MIPYGLPQHVFTEDFAFLTGRFAVRTHASSNWLDQIIMTPCGLPTTGGDMTEGLPRHVLTGGVALSLHAISQESFYLDNKTCYN